MRLVFFLILVIYVEAYIVSAAKYKEYRDAIPGMAVPDPRPDIEPETDVAQW